MSSHFSSGYKIPLYWRIALLTFSGSTTAKSVETNSASLWRQNSVMAILSRTDPYSNFKSFITKLDRAAPVVVPNILGVYSLPS